MPQVAIRAGIAKLNIWTSIASRAHPPTQAPNARLSRGARFETQANAPVSLATAFTPRIVRQENGENGERHHFPHLLLGEFKFDFDRGQYFDGLIVEKRWPVAPLANGFKRGTRQIPIAEI